jgi:hypothetical protein
MNDIERSLDFFKKTLKVSIMFGRTNGKHEFIKKANESIDDAIQCMEKQIPKEVKIESNKPRCPNCHIPIDNGYTAKGTHCKWCGQAFSLLKEE